MPPDGAEGLRRLGMVELKPDHGLDIRRVSEITARPVRWLWPGRIAHGKVTMIAGHPGLGKSQLALSIAAIVSTLSSKNQVILELKTVERVMPVHEAQMLTYLKLSGLRTGLLLNFNSAVLKDGLRRMVL